MTYDPRAYWTERAARQGPAYVGPGGHADRSEREADAFRTAAAFALGDTRYGTLLDFGCGSGRLAPFLAGYAGRYIGVDLSAPGLLHCPALPNAAYHWLDDDRLPVESGSVDLVTAMVVLQHIVDASDFGHWAGEIRRVLRTGGHLLVIDNLPLDDPAPHMRPRSPVEIGAATGVRFPWSDRIGGHWFALGTRMED